MGGACGTYWEKRNKYAVVVGKETRMGDLGVCRSAILKLWIYLAQDTDKWRPILSTVMNLCVLQNVGSFFDLLGDHWPLKNYSAPYS